MSAVFPKTAKTFAILYLFQKLLQLSFQWFQICFYNSPKLNRCNLIIVMYQYVTHSRYHSPFDRWMTILELICQLADSLAYTLDIVCDSMHHQQVTVKCFESHSFSELPNVAYVLQHKFQSCLITQWLSHISIPFLCQPVLPQKGEVFLLSPNPPVCQVGLAIRTLS